MGHNGVSIEYEWAKTAFVQKRMTAAGLPAAANLKESYFKPAR